MRASYTGDYYTEDQKQLIKESDSKPPSAVAAAVKKSLHLTLLSGVHRSAAERWN